MVGVQALFFSHPSCRACLALHARLALALKKRKKITSVLQANHVGSIQIHFLPTEPVTHVLNSLPVSVVNVSYPRNTAVTRIPRTKQTLKMGHSILNLQKQKTTNPSKHHIQIDNTYSRAKKLHMYCLVHSRKNISHLY